MENKELILLRTLLRSTSRFNILKFEKDGKKRGKIIGSFVGIILLYVMLVLYVALMAVGFGIVNKAGSIPLMSALTIILLEFIFTLFKTNGYLFLFKEYDLLMAMPFKTKSIVSCKFLYMYIKNLPMCLCTSLTMMIVYGLFMKPGFITYLYWVLLSMILPLIPMVIASGIGALIAKAGSKSRHKTLVQTLITFVFVLFGFSLRYIIEGIIRKNQITNILNTLSGSFDSVKKFIPGAVWFENAVVSGSLSDFLLLVGVSLIVYGIFTGLLGKYYRNINSGLKSNVAKSDYKMAKQKTRSVKQSIAFKEFKHFTNSTAYITNMGVGEILIVILCVMLIFVDMDKIIATVTGNSPLTKESLLPAIPLIVYFFVGMSSTTSASFSLEGKNFWILQSLPISGKDVIQGKMLFNMYLTIPFTLLGNIVLGIVCKAGFFTIILFIICGIALCAFSTAFGMNCNLKHYKHDWENEIEVIKQGSSVSLYLLPNMICCMILLVIAVIIGRFLGTDKITIAVTLLAGLLALLCYLGCMKKSKAVF